MKKNTIWLLIGGVVVAGAAIAVIQMSNKRKKEDETMGSATLDRYEEAPEMEGISPYGAKSAGQTIAESFAVILRRDPNKPTKVKKTPKKA